MEPDGTVAGHQCHRVEECHGLGEGAPAGDIPEHGERALLPSESEGLGHPDVAGLGVDQVDQDVHDPSGDAPALSGLFVLVRLFNLDVARHPTPRHPGRPAIDSMVTSLFDRRAPNLYRLGRTGSPAGRVGVAPGIRSTWP